MLKDAQKEIDSWVQEYKVPYWSPLSQFARLAEEVGELGRLLNHLYGDKPKKEEEARQELGKELMDVIFTAMCLANAQGIDLDEEFKTVMEKCRTRDKDRFEKKESA
ncbi:MAG TPA: nucleotide pyrophosphohydrolase [Candidatus Paceibacterota bacterium]|nr:nucleotide pyrophosphohydrolase [Candidatus Paceibacterota bacterium]